MPGEIFFAEPRAREAYKCICKRSTCACIYISAIYKNRDYLTDENADKMQKTKNFIIHYFDVSRFCFLYLKSRKFQ